MALNNSLLDGDLSSELFNDRTAEMGEIARFLHDTVAQDLVKLSFFLHQLPEAAVPVPAPANLDVRTAREAVARCCADMRAISSMLTPRRLADIPLHLSIEQYVRCFQEENKVGIYIDLDPLPPLANELEALLGTIVHMWTVRAVRSETPTITIRLRDREHFGLLELETFPAGKVTTGAGWSVVRERVAALGGEFRIFHDSGRLRCHVRVPIQ
ncbi:MAG: histidine kinase [Acidobacteriota bacterium]|nr:histidine kinase [Acidobacteriota bacterium]